MIFFKPWSDVRSEWVTPERLLMLIPLIIGSGIAALIVIALYLPMLFQVNRLGQAVQGLSDKVAQLPANRQKLLVQMQRFEQARAQEELLLNLVAGTGQLPTLQAELSQLAHRSGVAITVFEPQVGKASVGAAGVKAPAAGSPTASASRPASASTSAPAGQAGNGDPLLSAGLRKTSVLMTVIGSYPNLREFLLAVENLNVITIATDLKLNSSEAGSGGMGANGQPSGQTTMTLVLSTYDRPGAHPVQLSGARPKAGVPMP